MPVRAGLRMPEEARGCPERQNGAADEARRGKIGLPRRPDEGPKEQSCAKLSKWGPVAGGIWPRGKVDPNKIK